MYLADKICTKPVYSMIITIPDILQIALNTREQNVITGVQVSGSANLSYTSGTPSVYICSHSRQQIDKSEAN